jgi:GT2 family glycosyltransferase
MDDPKVGVVGMRLVFPEFTEGLSPEIRPAGKIQHAGMSFNIRGFPIHNYIGWSADHPRVMEQKECHAVTGAAMMTRRFLWNKAGGFLEAYGLGTWEDMDYCMSMMDLGYNIIVVPEALGVHCTNATAERTQTGYPMNHNQAIFMQRWGHRLVWSEWRHW